MKAIIQTFKGVMLLLVMFFIVSCKDDFKVRVKNNYPATISDLKVGPASYGSLSSGSTSSYQDVAKGDNTLSGNASNGMRLSGSVSISGKGKHKFTVTLTSSGGASIKED